MRLSWPVEAEAGNEEGVGGGSEGGLLDDEALQDEGGGSPEGGDAGGSGEGGEGGQGSGSPGAAGEGGAAPDGGAPTRPEWLSEDKFWDPDKGLKADLLWKNYRELVTKQSQGKLEGTVPEEPSGYELEMPEDFPENAIDAEQFDNDPLVSWFRTTAHELKLPQEAVSTLWKGYMDIAAQALPEPFNKEKELEQLGPQGPAIVQRLAKEAKQLKQFGLFNDRDMESFRLAVYDAGGAAMMHKLISHYQGGSARIPTRVPSEGLPSKQELDRKFHAVYEDGANKGMRIYEVDAAYREQVDREFEQIYGKDPAGTSVPLELEDQ